MQNSIQLTIDEKNYNFLSLKALIKSKKTLNRPKDREAVLILKTILEKNQLA